MNIIFVLKLVGFSFIGLVILFLISFFILGMRSKNMALPGLESGKLKKCPDKPNCFCTEYSDDEKHFLEPVFIPKEKIDVVIKESISIIETMGGEIKSSTNLYVSSCFYSSIFGFTDDFEIRLDNKTSLLHIRSGSRVGHSDFSVNQKRIQKFKTLLNQSWGMKN